MSKRLLPITAAILFNLSHAVLAHDLSGSPHYDFSVAPPLAQNTGPLTLRAGTEPAPKSAPDGGATKPAQAAAFDAFAPLVKVRWDQQNLFIDGNGLPAHPMMIGITAWQQQVPLPQNYTGSNAWQIPLNPVPAQTPATIKDRFLRGAIAIAANGIPIFNPQNNRGAVSAEIGELDQWGGHCGRADDYHYHAAPLHLQSVLGPKLPIAYALDGYPIYGLTEPDGSKPSGLDALNGHSTPALGYHYHASTKYPYVNGGFHGQVTEREGQVDPQPRAQPVRPDLPPLPGAKITAFNTSPDGAQRNLTYTVGSKQGSVNFTDMGNGSWKLQFTSTNGTQKEETFSRRESGGGNPAKRKGDDPQRPGGRNGPPRENERGQRGPADSPDRNAPQNEQPSAAPMDALKKPVSGFVLNSSEIPADGKLPTEFTGDGTGVTPPLTWKGAPSGTQSFALVMDHLAPGNVVKSYWVLWDIPASATSLPKNAKDIGRLGASFKGSAGYEPPHSQGPGAKTYVITLYALSAQPQISQPPREVSREVLLNALQGKVLGSASLNVVYSRSGAGPEKSEPQRPPKERRDGPNPPRPQ